MWQAEQPEPLKPHDEREQRTEPVALRLARLANACVTAQAAAAELELHEWLREGDAPAEARYLLASLFARRGAHDDALRVLDATCEHGNSSAHGKPPSFALLQLRYAIQRRTGRHEQATQTADELARRGGESQRQWLRRMQAQSHPDLPARSVTAIDQLAQSLIDQPALIPTLAVAQKVLPKSDQLALLRNAMRVAAPAVTDERHQLSLCIAMTELAMLADDHAEARLWAMRGLSIDPFAAPLAMAMSTLDDDSVEPKAMHVLEAAIDRHPTYPDLRMAMIRRAVREGETERAKQELDRWEREQPHHGGMDAVREELVA